MSIITNKFQSLQGEGKKALIAYLMGGDPSIEMTEAMILHLVEIGIDLIEIGVPFSDPLADGPTIQKAGMRALSTKLSDLIEMVERIRSKVEIPLLFMSYINPILKLSEKKFLKSCCQVGVDGVIIPDLIPDEGEEFIQGCSENNLDYIPLIAPTTGDQRIQYIVSHASGFLYYVSRTGITGVKKDIATDLQDNLSRIRERSSLPLVVGFGISNAEQAVQVTSISDGVVIGSAIVQAIADAHGDIDKAKTNVSEFIAPIIQSLHQPQGQTV